jgi:hypothetical protein
MDLKLSSTGDLAIENDDFVLLTGIDAIAQDVDVRLQFFKGEWFLDTRIGVPWYEKILGQKPRLVAVKTLLKNAVLSTPGVLSVLDFDLDYSRSLRTLSVNFHANSVEGEFEFNKELIL